MPSTSARMTTATANVASTVRRSGFAASGVPGGTMTKTPKNVYRLFADDWHKAYFVHANSVTQAETIGKSLFPWRAGHPIAKYVKSVSVPTNIVPPIEPVPGYKPRRRA